MLKMYLYVYLMIVSFMVFMILSFFMYFMGLSIMIEWVVFSVNSLMMEVFILVDWVSLLFMGLVLMITSMVIFYSVGYMDNDKFVNRFLFLVIMFVMSMLLMILSPSFISILVGWDLLGLVSYCLVMHYQNYSSYNSSMVTVLSNRVGDVGLLITIGLMINYGSWNIGSLMMGINFNFICWMIILAAITKSAQMPFSTWLPMAMAAPTPVSSLVHSSTLVTAGVYLIIRFNSIVMFSGLNFMLLYISIFTMIMSGMSALYENDLKKIIALSTLSQLGLMMMILSLGLNLLGFYHLLTHAIFKSLLFLCAGIIIHLMKNNQDIRYYGGLSDVIPFVSIVFYTSILSMMGCPFLAGFYSKDLIMEFLYIYDFNMLLMMMMLISLSLTVMYSLRLFYYLFFMKNLSFMSVGSLNENNLMNSSMILLVSMSIVSGSLLNWLFFFNLEGIYLNIFMKFLTLLMLIIGGLLCLKSLMINVIYMKSKIIFMNMMWNLNFLYIYNNKKILNLSDKLNLIDLEWIECVEVSIWSKIKIYLINWFYSEFKVYDIIKIQIFLIMTFIMVY